ncbi:zinc metalloprotease [Aspergillus lucknowensis]|uniref:Peptidase M43 pregnancy-associated plasma-A domain-containing protein n=1 Tax=Aspergillus lucknowensis TaxID=176173 RepID=A0ABR4L9I0_9EURO
MRFLPVLLGLSALVSARCGTQPPSEHVKSRHRYFLEKEDREDSGAVTRDVFSTTIETYVHVILTNSTGVNTTSLPSQILQQIDVLNDNYYDTGFSFDLVDVTYTRNNNWQQISYQSQTEWEVKSSLRQGNYTTLNLYLGTIGGGILGFATFPDDLSSPREFTLDGVVVDPNTLPNGKAPYDLGITAVHEVGHWLNLFHTFQPGNNDPDLPGCFGHGDYIRDTPAEAFAAFGCPRVRDTCRGVNETSNAYSVPGTDPIHNFMDYTDDRCLTHFTPGQVRRMQNSWVEEREAYQAGGSGLPFRPVGRIARPGSGW